MTTPAETAVPASAADADVLVLLRLARRVGMAHLRREHACKDYDAIKAAAQLAFAEVRRRGTPQQEVKLPDGTKAALITIEKGADVWDVDEDTLAAVIAGNEPGALEDFVRPEALSSPEVLALLSGHLPHLVGRRINPEVRTGYQRELEENAGRVADHATGERVTVATVTHMDPSGSYSVRWTAKGRILLQEAMDAGLIGVDGEAATPAEAPGGAGDGGVQ